MDDCLSRRSNTLVGVKATGGLPYACAVLKKAQFIDLVQCLNSRLSFGGQSSVVELVAKSMRIYIFRRKNQSMSCAMVRQMSISY